MAVRTAFVIAMALNIVNKDSNIVQHSLAANPDCVHRDAVFDQLNAAMTEAGYTNADILRESAALEQAIQDGTGYVTIENGSYIYQPNNNIPFNFNSIEEQTLFQKFVEIFRQLRDCVGGTFELLRGMNLFEQLNALLLASGLIGFATQCVNIGRAAGTCGYKLGSGFVGMTCKAARYTVEIISPFLYNNEEKEKGSGRERERGGESEIVNIMEEIIKNIEGVNIDEKIITKEETISAFKIYIEEHKINENSIGYDSLINIAHMFGVLKRDLLKVGLIRSDSEPVGHGSFLPGAYDSTIGYNSSGGRPRTKRRPYKSKRRRTKSRSSKKRRHYKTKKRVYRSTRFRTHR